MDVVSTLGINDKMTRIMTGIVRTLNVVISTMQRLDSTSNVVGKDALNLMRHEIRGAEAQLKNLDALLKSTGNNSPPVSGISKFQARLMSLYSAVQLVSMALRRLGDIAHLSDEFVSVNARLSLINDGLQTQAQLQEKVLKSANATRSSYKATAELISKIGMTGAITNNDKQIDFAEKVNKMLKIGGGTSQMNESALLQLSQSLSSGVMQGDEFKSLKENAPALMQNIAKGIGVNQSELKNLATQGKLTTDVIISAIDKMGGSIDEQFNKLPRTFGENATVFQNMVGTWLAKLSSADGALGQLNQKFTEFTNFLASAEGVQMLNNIGTTLSIITAIVIGLFDTVGAGIGIISDFGGVWEGIVVAGFVMLLPWIWKNVEALGVMALKVYDIAVKWAVANAPIIMVGLAIGLLIGILAHFGISASQVVGFVAGLFVGLVVTIINKGLYFYNMVGQLAVFLQNLFIDPVFAIQNLFYAMTLNVIGFFQNLVNSIIDGLNFIIRAAQAVGADIKELNHQTFVEDFKDSHAAPTSNKNVKTWENKYLDAGEIAGKASTAAMNKMDGLLSKLDKFNLNSSNFGGAGLGSNNMPLGENKNISDIGKVGKVGSIEKDVNIADEDIKMLYEMAVGNRVNQINLNIETPAPQFISNNNISKEVDFDEMYDGFAKRMIEESEISVKSKY